MRGVCRWLTALLFPPICRHCGKRQSIFAPRLPQVLCPSCLTEWSERMRDICSLCGKAHPHCPCMPKQLQHVDCSDLVKLARYRPGSRDVTAQLVLRCKDVNDHALLDFLASDLTLPAFRALQSLGTDMQSTVITYVPRRRNAVRQFGHDQAKELAKALAKRLQLPFRSLIRRKACRTEQKDLDADGRLQNAAQSFSIKRRADVCGQTVVLVDDICTTGATLACCTERLLKAGAHRVVAVCVAWSENKEKAE